MLGLLQREGYKQEYTEKGKAYGLRSLTCASTCAYLYVVTVHVRRARSIAGPLEKHTGSLLYVSRT